MARAGVSHGQCLEENSRRPPGLTGGGFPQVAATVSERLKEDGGGLAVCGRARQVERCPHCRGTDWGQWDIGRAGLPRFRCKACGRTFNGFTGIPFAYVKKREKLQAHA
jgi:hypothetical protein